ncbi:uncharacterized protein Bfra_003127 [Botrytis fragariae]|uniref:BTB domain-containing protein n=1 Tax=Botrytis fragariae TaxID=1964551 RepID=A0A8H6ELJ1_9HELO|nr:uncharacterized protein Bfra_003127 [Botrytis fragariae]KAF5876721.1 hypothetical protein Bfra_003127 [Botrytis fragariae]
MYTHPINPEKNLMLRYSSLSRTFVAWPDSGRKNWLRNRKFNYHGFENPQDWLSARASLDSMSTPTALALKVMKLPHALPRPMSIEQEGEEIEYVERKRKKSTKRRADSVVDGDSGMTTLEGMASFNDTNIMSPLKKKHDPEEKHATVESSKDVHENGRQYLGKQGNTRARFIDRDDRIRLYVGKVSHNRRTFHTPKALLRAKVKYFDDLFTRSPEIRHMNLPDKEPTSFALFLDWIQRGVYAPLDIEEGPIPFRSRIILYGLGVEYDLSELMDYTMTVLITNYAMHDELSFDEEYAHLIYLDTDDGSKLRSFVSHSLAISLLAIGDFSEKQVWMMGSGHPKLWRDVSKWMNAIKKESFVTPSVPPSSPKPLAPSKCIFHVHDIGAACEFMGDMF